jgi:hypothetical protein
VNSVLEKFKDYIEKETLSTLVENIENPDLIKEIEFEDEKAIMKLKK